MPTAFRTLSVPLLCCALAACGPKPPREQIANGGKTVASWAATGEMVARSWLQGDVPTPYARESLQGAGVAVQSARSSLESVAESDPLAEEAVERYEQLATVLKALSGAVDGGHRKMVARLVEKLPAEKYAILSLSERSRREAGG